MLLKQTDLKQTGAAVMRIDGEKTVVPLFSQDFEDEIFELIELTGGSLESFALSSVSNSVLDEMNKYKKEHNGCISREIMDGIRLGFVNGRSPSINGYC